MTGTDVRAWIAANGAAALPIDDLRTKDLPHIGWSGNPAHIRSVGEKLTLAAHGTLDYLAVRGPDGSAIAKCLVDYSKSDSEAEIAQLAVRDDLRGLGIGTRIIRVAEDRIRNRGKRWSVLGVEVGDERPRALYERLGYQLFRRERHAWEVEDDAGCVFIHDADVLMLRKEVGSRRCRPTRRSTRPRLAPLACGG